MAAVFGREPELTLADTFLEAASERFRVLLLAGDAGIGKTTVWREIVGRAEASGFRVLAAQPAETEAKLALSAVADLLEEVPEGAFTALPDPQRRALEVALLRVEPGAAAPEPRTLATALRSLLTELSSEGPLLVAIDDVQWLDRASEKMLAFALRRLADRRIGWLLTQRLGVPARLAVDELVHPEALMHSTIGPLTIGALHHVVKDQLGQSLSRSVLVRVHSASGGNPLYALEIARELLRIGHVPAGPSALPVPEDIRTLLSGRLRRLPAETREAVLTASALSDPNTSLVDEAALAPAEETDLVRVDASGRIAFRHPLYASSVYASASRARRRELHRHLARLVPDPEEQARHLALASTEPDESIANGLEKGASLARSRGAWESAADLLEHARRLTPPDRLDDARRRGIAAAEHYIHGGDRARARTLLEEIVAEPLPRSLKASALRFLGDVSYNDENFVEAERRFTEALEYADDPLLAVEIDLGLSKVHSFNFNIPAAAMHSYRALERAEPTDDDPLIAEALAHCTMFDYLLGRGVDWEKVERSVALEGVDRLTPLDSRPSMIAALLLLYVGRHAEARERLRALWAAAAERGDESNLGFLVLWLSWLETRSGNLAQAAALAEEAASLAALTGSQAIHAWTLAQRAFVRAHRGEVAETREDCNEVLALALRFGYALPIMWIAATLALLELSLGDPEAAWRACEPLIQALEQQGMGEPVTAFFLPDALEALIVLGELDRAEALVGTLEERGRQLDRPWALATGRRCRGLLLAARGDLPGAAGAVEEALEEHQRLDMPFERARTLLVMGVVERRARRRAQAKRSFELAYEIFKQIGARLWAKRAREELARLGLRRAARGELTAAESRVAELAAQGLSNREVAAQLFLSSKTVEANLARVYRKLGIASRAELGARMAEQKQK